MIAEEGDAPVVSSHEREMSKLRDAARQMGFDHLRDGSWFRRIVSHHVKKHAATLREGHWDRVYPGLDAEARAHRESTRVARRVVAAGALASLGASAGELLALVTDGLAAPVGVPAAAVSMALEAGYTAMLQIDLACDLASIYDVPFDPDDVGEVATLFGLALEVDVHEKVAKGGRDEPAADEPSGLTAKLMELEGGDIAARIGRKLLEDAVMKNIVPVAGFAISARWNYVGTLKLAAAVRKYVRYRRALAHALSRLRLDAIADPGALIEGAWLLATVDGDAEHEEVMALALIVDALPEADRAKVLDRTLDDDEERWFEGLARLRPQEQRALLEVLYLVAATDREVQASERRFLRRVGKVLERPIDFERIEAICAHFTRGEELPAALMTVEG